MSYSNDILDELRKTTSIVPDNTKKKKSSNDILDELRELAEADNEKRRKEQQKETLKSTVGTLGGDDDIAPVSTGKGVFDEGNKWYQGWVDKGALEDGFSAKNLAKTVLGTMNDNRETVTKAVIDATENLMDAGAHAVGTVGRIFSKDFQQKAYDFAAKDNFKSQETSEKIMRGLNWIDPIGVATNLLVDDTEEASVMGDKSDGMLESVAHMAGSAALGYLGVPTWLTQGINAFSPAFEEAKEAGATDTQATINAGVAAVAEVLIEKLSGGIVSGTGADDLFLKPIVKKISNKFAAGLLKFTGKAALEGVEEVATEFATDVSKRLTYDKDVFKDEDTFDRYVTTFLSGALMGIGGQAVEVGQAKSAGRNYSTGMTDAEYSVVDKLINDEVAKREADGKRVSQYQKNKIENEIIEKMEKGTIKVEEIESILGGDSYKTYDTEWNKLKSSDDWKALEKATKGEEMLPSLQKDYDELHKMKRGDMTGEQIDQETSLKSQIEAIQANKSSDLFAKLAPEANRVKQLRDKMRGEVSTMVKDSRLAESYRELERSKQDYTPDMTKYTNENAKKTVQNIIDSGLGNNSNAFRSKVDLLAKVSADTGVTYTLTKNSKLAGTEHYKIGYNTHGFIDDNGNIVINLDSDRLVETTAGHEVGHEFQKAGLDKKYSSILRDYCITKEGIDAYNKRIEDAKIAYKDKTNTTAEIEVANDLLGEYIFNDENFIKHLSTADRNVFQKVYDTIKYMCKIATAGSEEKRLLEKAKHEFEKAWREISKVKADAKTETNGKHYSMSGINSETADSGKLSTAQEMLAEGVDSETIRQETGWFKGYDGQWRYEVDDSEMEITKNLTSPMYAKYVDGEALKLDDIIKHDALFDAYPELRNTTVRLKRTLGKNVVGSYNAATDTLYVSGSIYLSNDMVKEMLIHEIQHKIQNIEGFARGSSPKYWETKGIGEAEYERFVANSEREKAKILRGLTTEERQDYLRYLETDQQIKAALDSVDADAILRGDDTNAMDAITSIEEIEAENDALYNKLYSADWFAKLQEIDNVLEEGVSEKLYTVFYKNTAGEIEARDVSNRVNYTEEQRKNTRPDIDKANVTFADSDNSLQYIGDTKDGRRCYQTSFDSSVSMNERIAYFKKRVATIFNLGAVELKTDVKRIRIKGDAFTAQKNLYGDDVARDGEKEARVNSLYDLADILATAEYDSKATAKEPSYANPALKPKNKAHKDVKYWYKFRNEIVFDGVPYTVTFNIRDKGSEQYQYLIEFKENKTPGLSNTAVKSLLRTDQVSYEDNIAPIREDVKYNYSMSGVNSKTFDLDELEKAIKLEDVGQATSEEIRQQTGWFRGYDGKWRYEISDRDMEFNINGFFSNPDIKRHRELEYKFITDTANITEEELSELQSLSAALEGVKKRPTKLGEYLKHDKLFEAYPALKEIKVSFDKLENGTLGKYRVGKNEIVLDNSLRDNKAKLEKTLIHEIQHAIQEIEDFAGGSSEAYWKAQRQDIANTIRGARENLDLWLADIGYKDFVNQSIQEVVQKKKSMDQHWEDCKAFKENSKYAEQIAACEAELAEYQRQYDEITNGMTAFEQYYNTAGEIEARDVENRSWRSEFALRETRPDIDRTDVVFAEKSNGRMYSLSKADEQYQEALDSGDTETLEKLVDESAKAAGYDIKAYHGTGYNFTVFDKSKQGDNYQDWGRLGKGFYFAPDSRSAQDWAELSRGNLNKVMPVYLRSENMLDSFEALPDNLKDTIPEDWDSLTRRLAEKYAYNYIEYMQEFGYDVQKILTEKGYDGINGHVEYVVFDPEQVKSADPVTYAEDGSVIPLSERFNRENEDIRFSMSKNGSERKSPFIESARDLTFHDPLDDFAPVRSDISQVETAKTEQNVSNVPFVDEKELFPDDLAPVAVELDALTERKANLENMMQEAIEAEDLEAFTKINEEYDSVMTRLDVINAEENERLSSLDDVDAPPVRSNYADRLDDSVSLTRKTTAEIAKEVKTSLGIPNKQMYDVHKLIEAYSNGEISSREQLYWELKEKFGTQEEKVTDERTKEVKSYLHSYRISVSDSIKDEIADFGDLQRRNRGRIIFSRQGVPVDIAYQEMAVSFPEFFPEDITNPTDQLMQILNVANSEAQTSHTIEIDDETLLGVAQDIMDYVGDVKYVQDQRFANQSSKAAFDALMADMDDIAPVAGQHVQKQKAKTSEPSTVREKIDAKIESAKTELTNNQQNKAQSWNEYTEEINRLQYEYDSKQNKNSIAANNLLRRIEKLKRMRSDVAADYSKRISDIEKRLQKFQSPEYKRSEQRRAKYDEYKDLWENMLGDTSTWKDKALGLSYKTTTMRRFLRDVVRDEYGKKDFAKADAIYDELETKYDHNEALLKRESGKLKESFFDMKLNKVEDTYAHMLGEFRHNPETTLTQEVVEDYYNKHKNRIDTAKVDHAIEEARNTFDSLIVRVNEVLREQGMKEIPYRKGYFPHFEKPKQGFLGKLLNWKKVDTEIPTSIAGLTETFNPERSWQSFNKQRKGDTTDYSLFQGLDTYIHGALDWIYHIEDIQKRRALENYIRYIHSEEGVQARIDEIRANETYDADEAQKQIELVLDEAANPLNNLVTELRARTNTLANKKSSMDRGMEEATNRKIYSTMTNINNRVNANMVVGSFSSALTNFIPMVQSWHQVSPFYTVRGLGDFVRSAVKDDGMIAKSDFLTNRLVEEEKLYQTGWDKVSDKAAMMMNVIDNITSQTVWRSKYLQNKHEGMSESQAIKDADQFAKNLIAGRSRGNMPTIFESKNPLIKICTAFQLEVANQYGFMFKDTPQDSKNAVRLVKGYAAAFMGAYLYNALYSSITGRDAAFDPIGIIEDLLRDLGFGDDEEKKETKEVILNFADNVVDEMPFISGLTGGGRVPLSSAMPYDGIGAAFEGIVTDVSEEDYKSIAKEMLNPLYYLIMPVGGGQVKKTVEGLSMFSDDHPVAGSYTDSGALRFPVEDTFGNKVKAALFGQWSSQNARDYIEQGRKPLSEKQLQEYIDLEMPIQDYWAYHDGLKKQETLEDKFDYIAGLDISVEQKNIMINNIVDRKDQVDMTNYDEIGDYEEFDFYSKNTEKYEFLQKYGVSYQEYTSSEEAKANYDSIYSWTKNYPNKVTVSEVITDNVIEYRGYTSALDNIRADKDENGKSISGSAKEKKKNYIFGLDLEDGQKYILFKSEYPADDTYNYEIIDYLNNRDDVSYSEMITILKELGFTIGADGKTITWD